MPPRLAAPHTEPAPVRAPRRAPVMRKVEMAWLGLSGEVVEGARLVPATAPFDEAFAALARGTLLPTSKGLVAIEDLLPGHEVRVAGGAMKRVLWRGSTMVVPAAEGAPPVDPAMARLVRVGADALGIARPITDLLLGPHARLVRRGPAVRALTGGEAALVPAADLADGVNLVALTPPSPVQVFHLGFERHERLSVHGVEVESQHPGPGLAQALAPDLLQLWLACFPHRRALADWGPLALPRLTGRELDVFDAA